MHASLLGVMLTLLAMPAPLRLALEAARSRNHDIGIARATLAQQDAALRTALAQLTPTVQASGVYTRNQYEAVVSLPVGFNGPVPQTQQVTITAYNGLTAQVGVNVPIINAAGIAGYLSAQHGRDAAEAADLANEADILLSTARTYYQVVADQGILESAQRALTTAQDSLQVAQSKRAAGTANQLTVDRAHVDVYRAQQTVASAEQALEVARRRLETLTGETFRDLLPPPEEPVLPEQTEEDWVARAEARRPELAKERETLQQQETLVSAAWTQLAPVVTGNATEHWTNAAGFIGHSNYWTAGVSLAWTLDPVGTPAALAQAQAMVAGQRHRLAQQQLLVRDDVHTEWLAVRATHARVQASASEAASACSSLHLIEEQFKVGTATSLDISTALRDRFNAEASLSQSRADLAAELLALRRAAGESLLEAP